MKTKNLLFYGILAVSFILASCDKEKDEPVNYSPLPVEQHKTNIEDAGNDMYAEVQSMEDEPAMQANISLANLVDNSDPFMSNGSLKKVNIRNSIAFAPVYACAHYNETGLKGMVKAVTITPGEDPESVQEFYDLLVGVYEWNFSRGSWVYTATGDEIVFLFPSEHTGTSNNASYTISYTGYTGVNPIDDYDGDLPQNVSAVLEVDEVDVSSFVFNAVYNASGYPTSIDGTFTLGTYVWYGMASNANNTAFTTEVSFKNADEILLKFLLDASGNWSKENIENNWEETYYANWYDEETNQWRYEEIDESEIDNYDYIDTDEEFNIHKVIKNGNASFQAMNMIMKGSVNLENFGDKLKEIDNMYNWETQSDEIVDAQVVAVNEFVNLSLRYADTDEVIALVEAYPVWKDNTYTEWEYNETTGESYEVEVTESEYQLFFRFVFADGSPIDAEVYFNDVFEELIDELEDWATELETTYFN